MLFSPIVRKQLVIVRTLLRWSADPGSCSAEIPALIFSDFSVGRHILRRVVCLIRNSSRTIMSAASKPYPVLLEQMVHRFLINATAMVVISEVKFLIV